RPVFKQPVRYLESGGRGRVMEERTLGRLFMFRWNLFVVNILLNVVHLIVWFVALWLLLRFQWSHALGLALIFWIVSSFAILPMLLAGAEEAGQRRYGTAAQKSRGAGYVSRNVNQGMGWHQVEARMCMMSPSWTM